MNTRIKPVTGRTLVGGPDPHATVDSPHHPVARAAEAELLRATNAHKKDVRHIVVIKDGVRIPYTTRKTDEEVEALFSTPFVDEPPAEIVPDTCAAPGHADFGEDPFQAAVARAVAAQLAQMGVVPGGASTANDYHGANAYPNARRPDPQLRVATDFAWDEPSSNGRALLFDRIGRYMKFIAGKDLCYSYVQEHKTAFRVLQDVVGNKPTGTVNLDDMDDVVEAISGLPLHSSKKPEYRELNVRDVVAKAARLGEPKLQLNSQQRLVVVLRTFFIWLENRNEARRGLLLRVRLHKSGRDFGGQRDWLDPDEILRVFDPKLEARFELPWQTWAMRLALFAGMRQTEIAQLLTGDIVCVQGIWCVSVSKGEGKRVKNKSSRRKVPIHDVLIAAGFLDYVEQAKASGLDRLFPDLKQTKCGLAHKVSAWYAKHLRQTCGISEKSKTFHSLRHSFATLADRSELRDEHIMQLLGHVWGNTVLRKTYTQELDVNEKHRELHRIKFPAVVMTPFSPERYALYFRRHAAEKTRQARLDRAFGAAPLRKAPRKKD
jgi:integrase